MHRTGRESFRLREVKDSLVHGAGETEGGAVRWYVLLYGPTLILCFAAAWLTLVALMASPERAYLEVLERNTAVLRPVAEDYRAALAAASVPLVLLAAATGLGRKYQRFDAGVRVVMDAAVGISVILLVLVSTYWIAAVAIEPTRWVETCAVVLLTWGLMLISQLIFGTAPLSQRRREAQRRFEAAERRARVRSGVQGLRRRDRLSPAARLGLVSTFFALPFVVWVAGAAAVAAVTFPGGLTQEVIAVIVASYMGIAIILVVWVGSADRSLPPRTSLVIRFGIGTGGMLVSSVLAGVMITTGIAAPLGIALVLATVLSCAVLVRPIAARVPLLMRIEREATLRSLQRQRRFIDSLAQPPRLLAGARPWE